MGTVYSLFLVLPHGVSRVATIHASSSSLLALLNSLSKTGCAKCFLWSNLKFFHAQVTELRVSRDGLWVQPRLPYFGLPGSGFLRPTEPFRDADCLERRNRDNKGIQIRELVVTRPVIFSRNPCQVSFPAAVITSLWMAGLAWAELLP